MYHALHGLYICRCLRLILGMDQARQIYDGLVRLLWSRDFESEDVRGKCARAIGHTHRTFCLIHQCWEISKIRQVSSKMIKLCLLIFRPFGASDDFDSHASFGRMSKNDFSRETGTEVVLCRELEP